MEKAIGNGLNPELPDYRSKWSVWSAHERADEGYTQHDWHMMPSSEDCIYRQISHVAS